MKAFNNNLFFQVQRNFIARCGDPSGTGSGGKSAKAILSTSNKTQYIKDEDNTLVSINKKGLFCMSGKGEADTNSSQFFLTLRDNDMDHLKEKHTIVGEVVEGYSEIADILNSIYVDDDYRPLQDVRILHTYVLDDPFDDYEGMFASYDSPDEERPPEESVVKRMQFGEETEKVHKTKEEIEIDDRKKQAKSRAEVLEMVGDLPDADIKAPENVLFVCKLNPITTDEDLELIFSRFGEIKECEIVKDRETGDSLQYAFIEFVTAEQCNEAYIKMNNVIVDDRRIKVDFSQSVSKMWNKWTMQPRKKPKTS